MVSSHWGLHNGITFNAKLKIYIMADFVRHTVNWFKFALRYWPFPDPLANIYAWKNQLQNFCGLGFAFEVVQGWIQDFPKGGG